MKQKFPGFGFLLESPDLDRFRMERINALSEDSLCRDMVPEKVHGVPLRSELQRGRFRVMGSEEFYGPHGPGNHFRPAFDSESTEILFQWKEMSDRCTC